MVGVSGKAVAGFLYLDVSFEKSMMQLVGSDWLLDNLGEKLLRAAILINKGRVGTPFVPTAG